MINICLAADNNYARMALMCMHDIIIRKKPDTEITFYILSDNMDEDKANQFGIFARLPNIYVSMFQLDSRKLFPERKPQTDHITTTTYLRFFIPDLLTRYDVKRVLYIDCDFLARKDLTELFSMDLKGKALGCTKDSFFIGSPNPGVIPWHKSDINAGLILMDIPRLMELDFSKKCIDAMKGNTENDQTIIDHVMKDEITLLPPICQIPYHNIIFNRFKNTRMLHIENWNAFHGTNYQSLDEMLEQAFFWHFHERKDIYLNIPIIKKIYDVSQARLELFLLTGKMHLIQPGDDECFEFDCRHYIEVQIAKENIDPGEYIDWKKYVDAIYCIHYIPYKNRVDRINAELKRVGILDSGIFRYHYTYPDPLEGIVFKSLDTSFLSKETDVPDNMFSLTMAYYHIFKEAQAFGYKRILIMEDDVAFLNDLEQIKIMLERLPADGDYIKFGKLRSNVELKRLQSLQVSPWYSENYEGGYWGSECTLFSDKAINVGAEILEKEIHISDYIFENRDDDRLKQLKRYIASLNITVQNSKQHTACYLGIIHAEDYNFTEE